MTFGVGMRRLYTMIFLVGNWQHITKNIVSRGVDILQYTQTCTRHIHKTIIGIVISHALPLKR